MKTVSVIIPNYNGSQYIEKTIRSCINQKKWLYEIIVVDDHSTDNSMELLAEIQELYPTKLRIYSNPVKGGNNARNFGFEKSSGELIQWLDADDYLLPGKYEKQVPAFNNGQVDAVYSDWYMDFYSESTERIRRVEKRKAPYPDFVYEILSDNWSVPASYLLTRELAEQLHAISAWNPKRKVAQDREYFTLAALTGACFVYVPGFVATYNRWPGDSVSKMDFNKRLEHQLMLESMFRTHIKKSDYSSVKQRRYLSLLNAHVMNACFYNPSLTIKYGFSLFNISWNLIHYKKIPFIPFIYIWQHIKYGASRVDSNV